MQITRMGLTVWVSSQYTAMLEKFLIKTLNKQLPISIQENHLSQISQLNCIAMDISYSDDTLVKG